MNFPIGLTGKFFLPFIIIIIIYLFKNGLLASLANLIRYFGK